MEWSFKLERSSQSPAARNPFTKPGTSCSRWKSEDLSLADRTVLQACTLYSRTQSRNRLPTRLVPRTQSTSLLSKQESALGKCQSVNSSFSLAPGRVPWTTLSASVVQAEISTVKSDLLDLKRDLATYDLALGRHTEMARVLEATDTVADQSMQMTRTMALVTDSEKALAEFISLHLEKLHQLRLKRPHYVSAKHRVRVDYGLKTDQGAWCFERLYAGTVQISGVFCLLKVTGNKLSHQIALTGQTLSGHKLEKTLLSIPAKEWDIRSLLSSKLYLSLGPAQELQLTYSSAHHQEFLQFLCQSKWGDWVALRAEQRSEGVVLVLPQTEEVPFREATKLAEVSYYSVQKFVSKSLRRLPNTHQFYWAESLADRFKSSVKPRLLSLFLTQRIIEIPVTDQHAPYFLNGLQFDLSLSQRGRKEVLVLSSLHHTVTVKEEDPEYRLLVGLQLGKLRGSWKSALRSLELKRLLQSLINAQRL